MNLLRKIKLLTVSAAIVNLIAVGCASNDTVSEKTNATLPPQTSKPSRSFAQVSHKEEVAKLKAQRAKEAARQSKAIFDSLLPKKCALTGFYQLVRDTHEEKQEVTELISLLQGETPKNDERINALKAEEHERFEHYLLLSRCGLDLSKTYRQDLANNYAYITNEDLKRKCRGNYTVKCGEENVEVTGRNVRQALRNRD